MYIVDGLRELVLMYQCVFGKNPDLNMKKG